MHVLLFTRHPVHSLMRSTVAVFHYAYRSLAEQQVASSYYIPESVVVPYAGNKHDISQSTEANKITIYYNTNSTGLAYWDVFSSLLTSAEGLLW